MRILVLIYILIAVSQSLSSETKRHNSNLETLKRNLGSEISTWVERVQKRHDEVGVMVSGEEIEERSEEVEAPLWGKRNVLKRF